MDTDNDSLGKKKRQSKIQELQEKEIKCVSLTGQSNVSYNIKYDGKCINMGWFEDIFLQYGKPYIWNQKTKFTRTKYHLTASSVSDQFNGL